MIQLDEGFEKRLAKINLEIQSVRKRKVSIYVFSLLYLIIGSILIISQRNLFDNFEFSYSWYKRSLEYLYLIFIGFGLIYWAGRTLSHYLKKTKTIREEKEKIDDFLNKHQIQYRCNVEFDRRHFGNHYAIVELTSDSDLLKNSKITFQI